MEKVQMIYTLGVIAITSAMGLAITLFSEYITDDAEEALRYSRIGFLTVVVFCFLSIILTGTL